MKPEHLIEVGVIIKPHGLKGAVKAKLDHKKLQEPPEVFFIEATPSPVPSFLKEMNSLKEGIFMLHFEETNNIKEAEDLKGKKIFLPEEQVTGESGLRDLAGYTLIDKKKGTIGEVKDMLEMPHQVMAEVNYAGKEVLVPLNEEFLFEINKKEKIIVVELPEGLLDI